VNRELPLIGLLRAPDPVRDDILRTFGDEEEHATKFAVRWAWDKRRAQEMTQTEAARLMHIKSPHLSNILNGKKYLPPHKLNAYEQIVGNRAVSMTIERFRQIRERELVTGLARVVAENMVRVG
jgi:hypothetical protein